MKHIVFLVSISLSPALLAGSAVAEMCTLDMVPAATLLLPYFEVDLDDPDGVTTLFSINNASPEPALAHLIFWTDWSYPAIDFDVYLTGYDVVVVNLRDTFNGNVPITSDAPNDPDQLGNTCGTKSPCGGVFSQNRDWDDTDLNVAGEQGFPFCDQIFPGFNNPVIVGNALDRLVLGHTGRVVPSLGACVGLDHGDNVARGYLTIDNVSECSLVLDPADTGLTGTPYFVDGGTGVANDKNQLWGDFFYVDFANNFMSSQPLVHIEADPSFNGGAPPTGYTFYGRYLQKSGRDNREPLGTAWGARYNQGGAFDVTDFVVWRDSTSDDLIPIPNGLPDAWCASGPSWYPLEETEVTCFDQGEDSVELCSGPDDPACFPLEAQRIRSGDLGMPFNFGWCRLNLNHTCPSCDPGGFGPDGDVAQSFVATIHAALGRFSGGLQTVELAHACGGLNLLDLIFADGFESGDTSLWSSATAR